jgi:hypothetical protein
MQSSCMLWKRETGSEKDAFRFCFGRNLPLFSECALDVRGESGVNPHVGAGVNRCHIVFLHVVQRKNHVVWALSGHFVFASDIISHFSQSAVRTSEANEPSPSFAPISGVAAYEGCL